MAETVSNNLSANRLLQAKDNDDAVRIQSPECKRKKLIIYSVFTAALPLVCVIFLLIISGFNQMYKTICILHLVIQGMASGVGIFLPLCSQTYPCAPLITFMILCNLLTIASTSYAFTKISKDNDRDLTLAALSISFVAVSSVFVGILIKDKRKYVKLQAGCCY